MNPWRQMFVALASLPKRVYARWTVHPGTSFHFAIPKGESIEEAGFSSDVEFPFPFQAIQHLEIYRQFGTIRNDLDAVSAAISHLDQFQISIDQNRILISLEVSPTDPMPR